MRAASERPGPDGPEAQNREESLGHMLIWRGPKLGKKGISITMAVIQHWIRSLRSRFGCTLNY